MPIEKKAFYFLAKIIQEYRQEMPILPTARPCIEQSKDKGKAWSPKPENMAKVVMGRNIRVGAV